MIRSWPLLAVACAAATVAGYKLLQNDRDMFGITVIAAALILLGAWIACEVRDRKEDE